MCSRQIFVAILFLLLAWQQVAAVVNNGPSSKVEESKEGTSDKADAEKSTNNNEVDSVAASSEGEANRREAPLALGDTYGAPAVVPTDSYLPSGPSSNLPVPIYGVPDAPSNNIVYPEPPPDIPPPVPSLSYGLPVSDTYGVPPNNYLSSLSDSYGPPNVKFEGPPLTPPKYVVPGPGRGKPVYGPPRPVYGPPGKPLHNSKFNYKPPFKNFGGPKYPKPLGTYGPPTGYFKDSHSATKFTTHFNGGNFLSQGHSGSSFSGHSSHSGGHSSHSSSGLSAQYGVPAPGIQSHSINLDVSGLNGGISTHYGVPDLTHSIEGAQSISTQYGVPDGDILGPPKPHYGPPQPSPHPKPPHPGAPAPPTPPDIKYDGWQPIPGLVSRVPTDSYGVPPSGNHIEGDHGYEKDFVPPPVGAHAEHQISVHESVGNLALDNSYIPPQPGAHDSYRAPLNTVTGSGAIVSTSGEESHSKHQHEHDHGSEHNNHQQVSIASTSGLGQDIQAVKSIGYEITSGGSGSITSGHGQSSGGYTQLLDTYGSPPSNSYSNSGPYAASLSQNNGGSSFGSSFGLSADTHSTHDSFNSFKSHKHKDLSLSNTGIGLVPPSGVYGVPPSGQYGTPLYTGPSLNSFRINPPKYPVHHREPIPAGVFDSITKQGASHKYRGHSGQSTYLSPPVPDLLKPVKEYGVPPPSNFHSLPKIHSAGSFQSHSHGSSSAGLKHNVESILSSGLSNYGSSANSFDGSYSLSGSQGHSNNFDVVGLDLSHPGFTIDLTNGHTPQSSYNIPQNSYNVPASNYNLPPDCSLKTQTLPSLSYGVPSANSYTASLSSLTTNIGGSHSGSSLSSGLGAYSGSALPSGSFSDSSFSSGSYSGSSLASGSYSGSAISSTYGVPELLPLSQAQIGYEVAEPKPHEVYGVPDLSGSHSHKGKSYGKSVAESFGPSSELIQSQSIDLNNIPLQGALGSYTLQIQSADAGQSQVPHGQVLNDGLLQSILAAIEQPSKGASQPIIQFQKSLEQQNFVTNDTISSVVEQLADAEIRHSTQLAKEAIEKTSELSDSDIQHSSPNQHVVKLPTEQDNSASTTGDNEDEVDDTTLPLVEDNGIALYFSNSQRSKKETSGEGNQGENKSNEEETHNSH
ncbi:hypothetical protein JTB14_015080 [Gonioctena quinquepunctata]|nr:hypothetical protein JTB14_015080 [Gonioctena quinquepunctata]